jgi:hypothetical protein
MGGQVKLIGVLAAIALSTSCSPEIGDAERARVYSAFLASEFFDSEAKIRIVDRTHAINFEVEIAKLVSCAPEAKLMGPKGGMTGGYQFPGRIAGERTIELLTKQQVEELLAPYPYGSVSPGIVRFSDIMFSEDRQVAVFDFWYGCGAVCGTGGPVRMARLDGKWTLNSHNQLHAESCGWSIS